MACSEIEHGDGAVLFGGNKYPLSIRGDPNSFGLTADLIVFSTFPEAMSTMLTADVSSFEIKSCLPSLLTSKFSGSDPPGSTRTALRVRESITLRSPETSFVT